MKLSELYGSEIVGYKMNKCGHILSVCYSGSRIEGYVCFDECEKEFYAEAEGAHTSGGRTIFVRLGKKDKSARVLRLGLPVYDGAGKHIGRLTDCAVSGGRIVTAVCGRKRYPFSDISVGDVVIVKGAAEAVKDMFIDAVCR